VLSLWEWGGGSTPREGTWLPLGPEKEPNLCCGWILSITFLVFQIVKICHLYVALHFGNLCLFLSFPEIRAVHDTLQNTLNPLSEWGIAVKQDTSQFPRSKIRCDGSLVISALHEEKVWLWLCHFSQGRETKRDPCESNLLRVVLGIIFKLTILRIVFST
jgi:hypothetical protein